MKNENEIVKNKAKTKSKADLLFLVPKSALLLFAALLQRVAVAHRQVGLHEGHVGDLVQALEHSEKMKGRN